MEEIQRFVLIPYSSWESQQQQQQHQQTVVYSQSNNNDPLKPYDKATSILINKPSDTLPEAVPQQQQQQQQQQHSPPPPVSLKTTAVREALELELKKDFYAKKILDQLFATESIEFSTTNTIIVDNIDTKLKVIDFIQTLRRKTGAVDDRHILVLDHLNLNPQLVNNRNALNRESGDWLPFAF